jgi:hypothetical protein
VLFFQGPWPGLPERLWYVAPVFSANVNVNTPSPGQILEPGNPLDTQVVELLGRQRLMGELLHDRLEVAVPARDHGIDLIAYADLSPHVEQFTARPIQMKASSKSAFSVATKYIRLADLIMAYVWHLDTVQSAVSYAMPYAEAVKVAEEMGWTKTASWQEGGGYSTSSPPKRLLALLEPYRMGPGKWWALVVGSERIA